MRHIAAVPAVGLLVGAAIGLLLDEPHFVICYVVLLGSASAALWAARQSRSAPLLVAIGLAFCAGGVALASDAWQRAWRPTLRLAFEDLAREQRTVAEAEGRRLPEDDEAFAVVIGSLRADAAPAPTGVSLSVEVDHITAVRRPDPLGPAMEQITGGILVTVVGTLAPARIDQWRAGRRISMPVQLHRPSRYLDPGVPDQERALARRGTTLVGTVKSGALVELVARGPWWSERIAELRAFVRRAIASAVGRWSGRSGAIVAAIVIGDRAGLDDEVERRLQEAGTYHVIAISGGNIAILAGLLLGAFRWAGVLGRGAMLAAIAALVTYAHLVGGGASVDRATTMAVVYFAARAIDQRSPPLNILALVVALLVAKAPLAVTDPGFILTFGATLAILLVGQVVPYQTMGAIVGAAATTFAASVAAEAMLFPVGALLFSRVTFAGLVLNLLAIPLMAVAQIAGMAVVPLTLVSPHVAAVAGLVAHFGAAGLLWSADLVQFAAVVVYRVAAPSWISMAAYYAGLTLWWTLSRRRVAVTGDAESAQARWLRRTAAATAVLSALWILGEPWRLVATRGDGRLHVTFIDVGQGDSILVRFPRGSTMVVDAGGVVGSSTFDIGDRVVAPVIRAAGIHRLDVVAVTHGDPDHIGGAASIVREFRPREVWEGIPVPPFQRLRELRTGAQAIGAWWRNLYAPDRIPVDGVDVVVRHPREADWERQRVRNDDSIVLELRWHDVSIVLTGDIEREAERSLVDAFEDVPLRVVKMPHHGSLTSSTWEFLRALRPQVAIASAGRSNRFGHPVPAVLERYRELGAEIFRTDQDGAVTVNTDGRSLQVSTFTGRRLGLSATLAYHEDAKNTKGT